MDLLEQLSLHGLVSLLFNEHLSILVFTPGQVFEQALHSLHDGRNDSTFN